jgi:OOP family OmpA-OmpF porin
MKTYNQHIKRMALILCLSLCGIPAIMGQFASSGYLNQANHLFKRKEFYSAAQYFEKYLAEAKKDPRSAAQPFAIRKKLKAGAGSLNSREDAMYNLAECYRLCHDHVEAEKWYTEAAAFPHKDHPLLMYWYAVSLLANGKYPEAMKALAKFQQSYTKMDAYLSGADKELRNLRFIQAELRRTDRDSFVLRQQAPDGINSAYAAASGGGDTIVFTGIRPEEAAGSPGQPRFINRLYMALATEETLNGQQPLPIHLQPAIQEGMASFSADGKRMFFTRWTDGPATFNDRGTKAVRARSNAAIYETQKSDTGWSEPVRLDSSINRPGFNSAQPFVVESTEGIYLLFSSDRPNGIGRYDLWCAHLDSAYHVLYVENMGPTVNSPGDEEAPFFHKNSRTLVFSSNGRAGMGGFDIYYCRGNISLSRWEQPENPGMPVNSSKDDLYFIGTDEVNLWNTGWLSSDRSSECCLGLFSFYQLNEQHIMGRVVDAIAHQPLEGALVTLTAKGHTNKIKGKTNTNDKGGYSFESHNSSAFTITAEKKGYVPASGDFTLSFKTENDTLVNDDICLALVPDTTLTAEVANIGRSLNAPRRLGGFDYKQSSLGADCYVMLDSLAGLLQRHPELLLRIDGYTDGIGSESYNLRLAKARVDACMTYLTNRGIAQDRLEARVMGKCCPLEPETVDGKDDPAAREKNRRVEYTILTK